MKHEPTSFAGLRVAAFESRRAEEMHHMIERLGGQPSVSPSMREVPLEDHREVVEFARRVIVGEIDVVILMTGVGTRHLMEQVARDVELQRFLHALSDTTIIVRGPKPVAALKEIGIKPSYRAAEPNTWREVLDTIDQHVTVANRLVGLQEYGERNTSLIAGLEARGAHVVAVPVYRWDLPEEPGPLEANVRAVAEAQRDVLLFTSAHQVCNVLATAARLQLLDRFQQGVERAVVASIGPTTSEALRQAGLPVDLEPEHSKMGHLVAAAARQAPCVLEQKRHIAATLQAVGDETAGTTGDEPWYDSVFMKACRREPTDRVPIWLMRQAGRYLPEYREIREKTSFLELCKNPQLAAEVMIRTVERLGVDAAIIFSDLLPILEPMGLDLEFAPGEGPVIHNPVRQAQDVDRVLELEDVASLSFVMDTVRHTRAGIPADIPVIGFAGAPFTLASYVVEGGASRNYLHTKTLMYRDEGAFRALMSRLARSVARYLNAQIAAGAQAVQLFDSWAGCLGVSDYRRFVLPHTKSVIDAVAPGTPVINFATGNPELLPLLSEAGGAVIGVDWRIELDRAWAAVGYDKGVQGNLDPTVLLATRDEIRRRAQAIVDQAAGRPGHIFNLGHGVLPQTPPDNVVALVEAVHDMRPSSGA